MNTQILIESFHHELDKLKSEIELYHDESNIWKVNSNITNSAGNLCLHIIGNLNHFIGATLGNTGYVRKRDEEFSLKNIPRTDLLAQTENTKRMIEITLEKVEEATFNKIYPIKIFQKEMSTEWFLIHILAHLTYHLGQINYHRRLLDQ